MRLLVAIDIHQSPERVVQGAAEWAIKLGATLDLFFVQEHTAPPNLIHDPTIRALVIKEWSLIRDAERLRLDALLASVPESNRGKAFTDDGRPAKLLVELGASYDGIVVGTHGRTGLGHLLLGSVAERVVRNATVSVLVLRLQPPESA